MATLKQRLHRKNSSGTYDTIHLETGADCITGTLGVSHGGTGKASWSANRLMYASASTTLNQLAFPTTAGSVLCQGTSGAPYWRTPSQLIGNLGVFKLATGSYAGTGTSGEASPTKITFPGTPLVWGIPGSQYASIPGGFEYTSDQPIIVGKVTRINYHIGNTTRTCNVSWSGNTASLWATEPFTQMNDADYIYFWYCIYKQDGGGMYTILTVEDGVITAVSPGARPAEEQTQTEHTAPEGGENQE